ncbi:MAG: c-type cytochrome [Polyangia bacterium]
MPLLTRTSLSTLALLTALGCSASATAGEPAVHDQVAEGGKLFGKYCAKCHGNAGQGTKKGPAVVGQGALPLDAAATAKVRTAQFHTAQDVAAFVATKMPANKPGSLTVEQYYDILAFDLKANGVDVTGKTIDAKSAAEIKLH